MYKYPLANSPISQQDLNQLAKWIKTNPRLTMGPLTKKFEKQWSNYINTKYSVFVNSGSSANLMMVYAALANGSLKKGDKVIVPACGWVTSISPIIQFGLKPIMVDADPDNFGLNFNDVEKLCLKKDIKGIFVVHPLGVPVNYKELMRIKNKFNLFVMEDCCASVGAEYHNSKKVGTIGDLSSFSFYFGHQLSTIEGGFINTSNFKLYSIMLMLRSHGWTKDLDSKSINKLGLNKKINKENGDFNFIIPGFNLRSTDLQAFIGLQQIKKADNIFKKRNQNHMYYLKNLNSNFTFQKVEHCWPVSLHIGVLAKNNTHRNRVIQNLEKNKIENRVWSHGNLGRHPFWKDNFNEFNGIVANEIYKRGFILPTYPELKKNDLDFIIDVCNKS